MKIPFIKYIESLVLAKYTPNQIFGELGKVEFNFPLDGVEVVYKTLHDLRPDYFSTSALDATD